MSTHEIGHSKAAGYGAAAAADDAAHAAARGGGGDAHKGAQQGHCHDVDTRTHLDHDRITGHLRLPALGDEMAVHILDPQKEERERLDLFRLVQWHRQRLALLVALGDVVLGCARQHPLDQVALGKRVERLLARPRFGRRGLPLE